MIRMFLSLILMSVVGCGLKSPPKPSGPAKNKPGVGHTDVLIYGGLGSWGDEIESLKELLAAHGKTYAEYDDKQFNDATDADFDKFSLVIFPGGDSNDVNRNLTMETRDRIRRAVLERGLNYFGLCSGAWLVVSPQNRLKENVYGFQFVTGPWLKQTPLFEMKLEYAVTNAIFPNGSRRKLLWFGGPITPNIPGGVIAKYGDGTPAITQMRAGKGFVILSGLHPTANKKILSKISLYEKEAIDPELGWRLLEAGITGKPLPAFSE